MGWLRAIHRSLLPEDPSIGWTPYLWLVYLSFFFIHYWYVSPSAGEVVAAALSLSIFLFLYFNGYWRRGWGIVVPVVGIGALGTVWAPVNPGAGVFFIYAASFAGWLGPTRRALLGVGLVFVWGLAVAVAWQPRPQFWLPVLLFAPLIGLVSLYYSGQVRRDAALRLSQEEVRQLARVAERERISRDLHDLLGHTLSVVALKAELSGRLLERDPKRAREEIREVEEVARAALAQVREAVTGFRMRGLAGELEHARLALKAAAVDLEIEGAPPSLAPAQEAVLALILREAVTNVIRHAEAHRCVVRWRAEAGELLMEVHDDGSGGAVSPGGGIEGMRDRLASVGGRLDISAEYGIRLRAWLPLEVAA